MSYVVVITNIAEDFADAQTQRFEDLAAAVEYADSCGHYVGAAFVIDASTGFEVPAEQQRVAIEEMEELLMDETAQLMHDYKACE